MVRTLLAILAGSILVCCAISCKTNSLAVDGDVLGRLDNELKLIKIKRNQEIVKKTEEILTQATLQDHSPGDFVNHATGIASGRGFAKRRLMGTPEMKFLIEHPEISLPLIYERLVSNKWKMTNQVLCVYFIVLEKTKRPESLPYLIDYLYQVSPEQRSHAINRCTALNPFSYAVDAVLEFTGPSLPNPYNDVDFMSDTEYNSLFDNRLKLANDAQKWYDNYKLESIVSELGFISPLDSWVSENMSYDSISFKAAECQPVRAVKSGLVTFISENMSSCDKVITIKHSDGFFSFYAHISEILVKVDQVVKQGDVIARSGKSGIVTQSQLYFRLFKGDTPVNPLRYLP